jgi:hypothetical protein
MLFASTLEMYVDERYGKQPFTLDESHPPSPWWSNPWQLLRSYKAWLAIPAIVLLLVFLAPKVFRWLKLSDHGAPVQTQRASIERQIAEFNKHPTDQNVQALPTYELPLESSLLREDGGIKRATLTPDIKILTLKLALAQVRHEKYRALVLTVEGNELFAIDGLTPEAGAGATVVSLKIPTEFLTTGDYQIQLRGVAPDGQLDEGVRYSFRVIKQK